MKYFTTISLIISMLGSYSVFAESIANLANQVSCQRTEHIGREDLPKGKEEDVIQQLRKHISHTALLRLNDQQTIDKIVKQYKDSDGSHAGALYTLRNCKSPYVLDELSTALYADASTIGHRTNPDPHLGWDYGHTALVARWMMNIVATAPEFTEETKIEAEKLERILGARMVDESMVSLVADVREWWELNKQALLEERYGEVTPPKLYHVERLKAKEAAEQQAKKERSQKLAEAQNKATQTQSSNASHQATDDKDTEANWKLHHYLICLGIFAALAALLGRLCKKKA